MTSLPTQFELFAQSFCADLDKINERVNRLNHKNTHNEFSPHPPPLPIPPNIRQNARLNSPRYRQFIEQRSLASTRDRDSQNSPVPLSSRINATAKIVKPKPTAPVSPRHA